MTFWRSKLNEVLIFLSKIRFYKYPFSVIYNPKSHHVNGDELRKIISVIQPGDLILRAFNGYMDSWVFPGKFSHIGIYLGETPTDHSLSELQQKFYKKGDQIVIHSMAKGVFMEDLLNFCRCDYLLILRRNNSIELNWDSQKDRETQRILDKAKDQLGKEYDFSFEMSETKSLYCSELVFFCLREFASYYNVKSKLRWVLFEKKTTITPDDFITDKFRIVFKSQLVSSRLINKIVKRNLEKSRKSR